MKPEQILDVKHGEVGGSDDLGCEPDCVPSKGVHVLRSSLSSYRGQRWVPTVRVWPEPDESPTLDVQNHVGD